MEKGNPAQAKYGVWYNSLGNEKIVAYTNMSL